jgi:hypothetical protein
MTGSVHPESGKGAPVSITHTTSDTNLGRDLVRVLPDNQAADTARSAECVALLTAGRDQLLAMIRDLHPAPGCLPVPLLRIPESREQFGREIDAVAANLRTPEGWIASAWRTVWGACDHECCRAGAIAHELVGRWHILLIVCQQYLHGGPVIELHTPATAAASLETRILTVAPRDHAIAPSTVAELTNGQQFSLDTGKSWHVCEKVLPGSVSVYTGEHNTAGEPWCDSIPLGPEADPRCLVRSYLTA